MISINFTSSPISLAFLLALVCAGILLRIGRSNPSSWRKPPGPKGLPFLGNVFDTMSMNSSTFSKWGAHWGNVVSITVFGQPIIILNSWKAAIDLLEKRGANYSDRPPAVFCTEMIGWKDIVLFASYGDRLREQRRLVHNLLSNHASMDHVLPTAQLENYWQKFLCDILNNPENFAEHAHNTVVGILLQVSHGSFSESRDFINKNARSAMEQFSIVTAPGASMVDVFPSLRYVPKWFPGVNFHQQAEAYAKVLQDMVNVPFDIAKRRIREGTATPSFISSLLQDQVLSTKREELIKWTAASIYFGGANTTVPTILTFFLAMTLNPDIQRRAQAEIDAVTGGTRFPSLNDRGRLPYVDAIVKEVFRWNPAASLGLRRTSKEDVYENYLIPKDSIVIVNIRGFLHNPHEYKDPATFNPDRFMPSENGPGEKDPRPPCFGFGRRVCPGSVLADSEIFLACALTLATFDIAPKIDAKKLDPSSSASYFTTSGFISWPHPFKCDITPRSPRTQALISYVL